ncbi:MAG: ATP-dependent dethiobiotin synthetase BioD [Candidatus Binatia bacterium]|nr:MAG: ATP-dependent dethiobiotin synthetase BioD [Candidatus Binatia bacterium]
MSNNIIFVTGTDTGVGKTTVTGLLAAGLRSRGLRIAVFKPAETGCSPGPDGSLLPADAARLRRLAGTPQPIEDVCPYTFREPLAPAVAARREGRSIDFRWLCAQIRSRADQYDLTLVEGAGGWLVPLAQQLTFADLAMALGAEALVIVANRLGALNHALLTVQHVRMCGLRCAGYVWNHPAPITEVAQTTNPEALREWLGPALGSVPYLRDGWDAPDAAARIAEECFDLDGFLRARQEAEARR